MVTITSAEENAFLVTQFAGATGTSGLAFIGGFVPVSANPNEWFWADGPESGTRFSDGATPTPPSNYANWVPSLEPNRPGTEFVSAIALEAIFGGSLGEWFDTPNRVFFVINGYIVEYSGPFAPAQPVPAVGARGLITLSVAILALGVFRSKRGSFDTTHKK
ncbi:MAG: hypothetical protein Cons2KO_28460 [Congregibacter sp.]